MVFTNRLQAGQLLAQKLIIYNSGDTVVVGLVRGGVVVAAECSRMLHSPLYVLVVKKLASNKNREFAYGAVAPNGITVIHTNVVTDLGLKQSDVQEAIRIQTADVIRKMVMYGQSTALFESNKTILLVDDGVATGATMEAAIAWSRNMAPRRIIVAVPVIARRTYDEIAPLVTRVVALNIKETFRSVGEFYQSFVQVSDEEVVALVAKKEV